MITQERLKEAFDYNSTTGEFIWKIKTGSRSVVGEVAGSKRADGYVLIKLDKYRYLAHRLIWLYFYGEFPEMFIDHINGDPSDNRIENLRIASMSENMRNRSKQSNNTSGYKGVFWHKGSRKYKAVITVNGKQISLGYFIDPKEAHDAYINASHTYHKEFAAQ